MAGRRKKNFPRELPVQINAINDKGLGTVHLEQEHGTRQLNIKGALPGEKLSVDVLAKRRGQWYGVPHTFQAYSEQRVSPPCQYFLKCGGCSMQHMNQKHQLEAKNRKLIEALEQSGVTPKINRQPVAGPKYLYRRRARMGVKYVRAKERVLVGFREGFGGKIVEMSECLILAEPFSSNLQNIQMLIASLSICDRIPQIEMAAGDREAVIILRHLAEFSAVDLELISSFCRSTGIQVYSQSGGYETVTLLCISQKSGTPKAESLTQGKSGEVIRPRLDYTIPDYGITIFHDVTDFVQINIEINRRLIEAAICSLDLNTNDRVLDLFCGVGNFSLPMARMAGLVLGLEGDPQLVLRAKENALYNGLSGRAFFEQRDLYADLQVQGNTEILFPDYNKMLVDPPRSGIGAVINHIGASRVERLVYVSCNPKSFAEDAAQLLAFGFILESVRVFDMFPQTTHVETLGLFSRNLANSSGLVLDKND
ncbi:MAG: 23S rRNA (uracil(1939)-C(5))-methyltransferase RlmD [Pseudomonadales bacterium]|nr:23S rRNA (uracil(1939)-C(5))-methyltransferase RlmD [Pseudomonadales bacterium]